MAKIKKNLFGKYTIHYNCKKCSEALTSPLKDAGNLDTCPHCGITFDVPGAKEKQQIEQKLSHQRELDRRANEKRKAESEQNKLDSQLEKNLTQADKKSRKTLATSHQRQQPQQPQLLVSSGGVNRPYKVLGLVTAMATHQNSAKAYLAVLDNLKTAAANKGGNAILFVSFQNRVAIGSGCFGQFQVLEVWGWGTAAIV